MNCSCFATCIFREWSSNRENREKYMHAKNTCFTVSRRKWVDMYCKHGLFHGGPIFANKRIFMSAIFMRNYILNIVNTRKFNPFEKKTTHLQYLAIDSERYCQNDEGLNNWQSASLVCFPGSWDLPIEWLIMVCQSNNSCKSLFSVWGFVIWKDKKYRAVFFPRTVNFM